MTSAENTARPDYGKRSPQVSRRGFLGKTAVAGSVTAVTATMLGGSGSAQADPTAAAGAPDAGAPGGRSGAAAAPLSRRREMLLQVARVGAVYPVEFRGFGESAEGAERATPARLRAAERRLDPERLARAWAGADALIALGLLGAAQGRMLAGIGRQAAQADADGKRDLLAFVALGVATLSPHFDPADDHVAEIWLGGLSDLQRRGRQPQPIPPLN